MRKLGFGALLTACVVMGLLHCGGGPSGDSSSGSITPPQRDATPVEREDSSSEPSSQSDGGAGPEPAPLLTCTLTSSRKLAERPDDGEGHSRPWLGQMRTVRVDEDLVRTVAQPSDEHVRVYSFDPDSTEPATSVELPFDRVLDTAYEDGALYVYGLAVAPEADGGTDTGLYLSRVDDATGEVTTRRLTLPNTLPKPTVNYEPPLGQFVRWGTDDVYFTYTEELPPFGNPSYRLSVGRVSSSSGPVAMTVVETRGPHHFQEISARDLVHAGSSVHAFMGNSAQNDEDDGLEDSTQWILPDDGTIPATITKRFAERVLLATRRDGTTTHLAYADQNRFLEPYPRFAYASADDTQLATFNTEPVLDFNIAASVDNVLDVHFEGDQLLWFPALWFDMKTHRKRADLPALENLSSPDFLNYSTASITFAEPPSEDHAKLYVVIPRPNVASTAYGLWLHVVTCAR